MHTRAVVRQRPNLLESRVQIGSLVAGIVLILSHHLSIALPSSLLPIPSTPPKQNWPRTIITLLITLCILYFIVGALVAWFGGLTWQNYMNAGGIVGGLASVLGLLSLARPGLDQSDIDRIDGESLKKLAGNSEQIRQLEAQRSEKIQEIGTLEERQQTLELFVRKAALSLFLKERLRHTEAKVADRIKDDPVLIADLTVIEEVILKLVALEEEIESDPNVELLRTVIASAYTQELEKIREMVISPSHLFFAALDEVGAAFVRVIRSLIR
jgi:hypothetical protein